MTDEELLKCIEAMTNGSWKDAYKLASYLSHEQSHPEPKTLKKQQTLVFGVCFDKSDSNFFAKSFLGKCYENGWGTSLSPKKCMVEAENLYEEAANKNNPLGLCYLAFLQKINKNIDEAKRLYTIAAKEQYPSAIYGLGLICEEEHEIALAKKLYLLAAEKDYPDAYLHLYRLNGSTQWDNVNPFKYYSPKNNDMRYVITENTQMHVWGGGSSGLGSNQTITPVSSFHSTESYNVVIEYTGPVELNDRKLLKNKMPNFWRDERNKIPSPGFCNSCCCICCYLCSGKPVKAMAKAMAAADILSEKFLADELRKADLLLTERLPKPARNHEERTKPVKKNSASHPQPTRKKPAQATTPKTVTSNGSFSFFKGNTLYNDAKTKMKLGQYENAMRLFKNAKDHLKYASDATQKGNQALQQKRLEKIKTHQQTCMTALSK